MNSLLEDEELMPGTASCKIGSDSLVEFGLGSFVVASHPPEPIDSNVSMPACMWIGQNNSDGKCLITSLPMKNGIDCISVAPVTTIFNSHRSTDCSNSLPRPDKNCGSTKESIQGDSLASAKTSLSQVSSISGFSDDSNWSNTTDGANKPHKENDPQWKAICAIRARVGVLGAKHFRLLNRLGSGDIGSVYLSELIPTRYFFAMKVMDKASLARRNKFARAKMEKEILQLVDHPFLPTLYTHFETDRFSCLVMEYCPGGDLYTLRQRQPKKRFSEHSARFYAAEVLLALEYLHMVGVVYRDLKPENVLVRADGHIMLSDFDLSLRCAVSPTVITNSRDHNPSKPRDTSCLQPSCALLQPGCIQPGWFFSRKFKKKSIMSQADTNPRIPSTALPEVVVEPTLVRSMSFVGTHEYLAPEIIKGEGHGSAVDWWTFGIFLHELLYGKTPFKGSRNRMTLYNVVEKSLKFPRSPGTSYTSRDLIVRLLAKEPEARLGVKRGAAEIKQHPFFEGVNWALIRCSMPPEVPGPVEAKLPEPYGEAGPVGRSKSNETARPLAGGKYLDFEFF